MITPNLDVAPPSQIVPALFTLAGVILGFVGSLIITARTNRAEHKRQLREIGLKMALCNFEWQTKNCEKIAKSSGCSQPMYSLPVFVVEGMQIAEIVGNTNLTAQEIGKRILEVGKFTTMVGESGRYNPKSS